MREMDDASPRLDDSSLTDRATRVLVARKAWIERRQTCISAEALLKINPFRLQDDLSFADFTASGKLRQIFEKIKA